MSPDDDLRVIPRLASDADRRALKSATDTALEQARGGSAFEPFTRVKKAALSKYASPSEPEHFMPLDVALELDRRNGAPLLTATLAGMLGYRLVPAAQAEEDDLCLADAQAVAKETGDVVNLLLTLLASGKKLAAADRDMMLREVSEAKATLFRLAGKIGASA